MKTTSVEAMVRSTATTPLNGRLNLVQFRKEKQKALQHKGVCEAIVNYANSNPLMPFYAILAIGVGSGSFKNSSYAKGYTYFNESKVKTCYDMAVAYNHILGIKGKPSDVTWRLVNRYYNKVSHNIDDFIKVVKSADNLDGKRGHFTELCKVFGM